jgi:hypothetical protein
MAQAIFEPTVSCINTLTIPKPSYSSYLPACEDGTQCPEMSAYKIQMPGKYPKKAYNTFTEFGIPMKLIRLIKCV